MWTLWDEFVSTVAPTLHEFHPPTLLSDCCPPTALTTHQSSSACPSPTTFSISLPCHCCTTSAYSLARSAYTAPRASAA